MAKVNKLWEIVKNTVTIDMDLPNQYGGMVYEFVEMFEGTDSQAERYVIKLEKAIPEPDTSQRRFERIEYCYCVDGYCDYLRDVEKIFKVIDYRRDEINLESLSKEELIELLRKKP